MTDLKQELKVLIKEMIEFQTLDQNNIDEHVLSVMMRKGVFNNLLSIVAERENGSDITDYLSSISISECIEDIKHLIDSDFEKCKTIINCLNNENNT